MHHSAIAPHTIAPSNNQVKSARLLMFQQKLNIKQVQSKLFEQEHK